MLQFIKFIDFCSYLLLLNFMAGKTKGWKSGNVEAVKCTNKLDWNIHR